MNNINKTLYILLYGKAYVSKKGVILHDEKAQEIYWKKTLRHEIMHAFLNESGLSDSSNQYGGAWAKNEEMVDWIALQGEKIYNAWKEANAL